MCAHRLAATKVSLTASSNFGEFQSILIGAVRTYSLAESVEKWISRKVPPEQDDDSNEIVSK